MREIEINPVPLERLAALLSPQRAERLMQYAEAARDVLRDVTNWHVNATGQGGGVAEMLQTLLAYGRGAGVDTRWLVLDGDQEFFTITKRLHNLLHGSPGDGGPLGDAERAHYARVLDFNLPMAAQVVRAGDIVLLHDPQTAGLVDGLRALGAAVIWRCHIGRDTTDELTDRGWDFLRPYIEGADGFIFSRQAYVPDWVPAEKVAVIAPSIDPFSAKNVELTDAQVAAALAQAGLVGTSTDADPSLLSFDRRGNSTGTVRPHVDLVHGGGSIPMGSRLVVQVSRWDRLKDMTGVLRGFVSCLDELPADVHLALVGPEARGVSDDPEGLEVLEECCALWASLGPDVQDRVHLVNVPMDDVDENAHLVNAIQQHAAVVVQKSLVEGFGLTVTEAMWKARPVVASAVGGIRDQIVHGVHGLLLEDPSDVEAFGRTLVRLFADPAAAERMGQAAKERVREEFLGDRHLIQYVELFSGLLARVGNDASA